MGVPLAFDWSSEVLALWRQSICDLLGKDWCLRGTQILFVFWISGCSDPGWYAIVLSPPSHRFLLRSSVR